MCVAGHTYRGDALMGLTDKVRQEIEKQLAVAREKLLDLTLRNRLLNFRATKATTIRVVDEIPREIYDIVVLNEKSMSFLPTRPQIEYKPSNEPVEDVPDDTLTAEEASVLWDSTPPPDQVESRHVDLHLQTSLEPEALNKRLFFVYQKASAIFEETGVSVLYLALGFLRWTESNSGKVIKAPLIMVPVELVRISSRTAFKVKWSGDDIITNISLQSKLREQAVEIPDFEMPEAKEGIDQYFQAVASACSGMKDWDVTNEIYLGFFSFSKFLMYRDLDPGAWVDMSPAESELIRALFAPEPGDPEDQGFDPEEIDSVLDVRKIYHVMDADPSQTAVVQDVKEGRNLVVEGPPGTGKSQTIANAIAELLTAGKTVLFVSEKMAALEVVKERLGSVGIGDYCLELHSRKAKKKEVLAELQRSLNTHQPRDSIDQREFSRFERLRKDLNDYVDALHTPIGERRKTPYALFGRREQLRRNFDQEGIDPPTLSLTGADTHTEDQYVAAVAALENLERVLDSVGSVRDNPWRGCAPGTVLPHHEQQIRSQIGGTKQALKELATETGKLSDLTGTEVAGSRQALQGLMSGASVMASWMPADREVLNNSDWDQKGSVAATIIDNVKSYAAALEAVKPRFRRECLRLSIDELDEYSDLLGKTFRLFYSRYRELKTKLKTIYIDGPPRSRSERRNDVERLRSILVLKRSIEGTDKEAQRLFRSHWRGCDSSAEELEAFAEWIVGFRRELLAANLSEKAIDILAGEPDRSAIRDSIANTKTATLEYVNAISSLRDRLSFSDEVVFGAQEQDAPFERIAEALDLWAANVPSLWVWATYLSLRRACVETIGEPVLRLVDDDTIARDLVRLFKLSLCEELLAVAFESLPPLATFMGTVHDKKIVDFRHLDKKLIQMNRRRVANALAERQPTLSQGMSRNSEGGILIAEFQRKRGHRPIRKLLTMTGGLVQKIKPCFMMSPVSIAQFLDPRSIHFDVIIFDEASQVRPEDALGALLRGSQLVVMGDTRQLPPTSFFDHIVDEIEEDPDEVELAAGIRDIESILQQCRMSFPQRLLDWHYRSRHESLIAVSNQEFYENRLLVYPSAIDQSVDLGVHFVHLPESVYDRGRSSINRLEARAVAAAAVDHYRQHPGLSLGVGTFNIRQQDAILEEVELQCKTNPEMEKYFAKDAPEHFFVKNLETIQGDERDTIFISVGFGFDSNGKLSKNFGPLNQMGGERRLNVLITRARRKCVVFSNFTASQLPVSGADPFGVRALKTYLQYAETRHLESLTTVGGDVESPFEEAVYDFLRASGFEVKTQVGCAGFRVDMAVVNPEAPGSYLIGIECDGARYHSAPTARARDRLRQEVLENLGWQIHRVWSTDWYRDPKETQVRLLAAVHEASKTPPSGEGTGGGDDIDRPRNDEQPPNPRLEAAFAAGKQRRLPGQSPWEAPSDEEGPDPYKECRRVAVNVRRAIEGKNIGALETAVLDVIAIEAPIHVDEVAVRLRELSGLKRTGHKIHELVNTAIRQAGNKKRLVVRSGGFCFKKGQTKVPVRHRSNGARLNYVSHDELSAAAEMVLTRQHATEFEDLVTCMARLIGVSRLSADGHERIATVVKDLIDESKLVKLPNGMINLPQ